MNVALAHPAPSDTPGRRIRVMVVDDAVVVRGLYARWVEAEPDLEMAAALRTGREAVSQIERIDPDVVVLDIEMPELDGIAALPLLLQKKPNLVVLMASTVTRRNAEISLRALALGAADYIPKPASAREVTISLDFRRELIDKVRQLGQRGRRLRATTAHPAPAHTGFARTAAPVARSFAAGTPPRAAAGPSEITLRPMPLTPPRVLVVGASTGGPQALNTVITQIGGVLDRAPVLITQHMPATFTTILAEHLTRAAKRPVREAKDGEAIDAGTVYIAPGGRHMSVERRNGVAVTVLTDGDPINFCKPSVDPLFATAGTVWGSKALGLMLTGMGADGLGGARELIAAGGNVLAQDEASSVIWGMPGQIAHAGLASALIPLDDIGARLTRLFAGERA